MRKNLLKASLIGIWLLHLTGVFVPETGFDAVWYHLPVMKAVIDHGGLVYLPELYQSLNPLFSDLIFGIGMVILGDLGAKVVAYLFALGFVWAAFKISRKIMSTEWALVTVVIISTFQAVTWQASSFYVDVAKGFWELLALWWLIKWSEEKKSGGNWLMLSGLAFGASLATKLFSLLLWPVMWGWVWFLSRVKRIRSVLVFSFAALFLPLPFYGFAYVHTGDPFYSVTEHLGKIHQLSGVVSPIDHVIHQTLTLPKSIWVLLIATDYISILLVILLPFLWWQWHWLKKNQVSQGLLVFGSYHYLLWWYIPPPNTRYVLSGFAVLMMVLIAATSEYVKTHHNFYKPVLMAIWISILLNLLPRFYVLHRNLPYLLGRQSKQHYLEQFYDSNIDQHLKKWHQL